MNALLLFLSLELWKRTSVWNEAWSSGGGSMLSSRRTSVWCSNWSNQQVGSSFWWDSFNLSTEKTNIEYEGRCCCTPYHQEGAVCPNTESVCVINDHRISRRAPSASENRLFAVSLLCFLMTNVTGCDCKCKVLSWCVMRRKMFVPVWYRLYLSCQQLRLVLDLLMTRSHCQHSRHDEGASETSRESSLLIHCLPKWPVSALTDVAAVRRIIVEADFYFWVVSMPPSYAIVSIHTSTLVCLPCSGSKLSTC